VEQLVAAQPQALLRPVVACGAASSASLTATVPLQSAAAVVAQDDSPGNSQPMDDDETEAYVRDEAYLATYDEIMTQQIQGEIDELRGRLAAARRGGDLAGAAELKKKLEEQFEYLKVLQRS